MDVKLPKLGEGADSGVVVNILVNEGDEIANEQAIIELENEKAVASIPTTSAGRVTKIHVKTGDKISVGQKLISLETGDDKPSAEPSKMKRGRVSEEEAETGAASKTVPVEVEEEAEAAEKAEERDDQPITAPVASPSVRKVARELGIDLSRIRGSESGGRIVLGDIRAYIQKLQKVAEQPKAAAGPSAPAKPAAEQIDFSKWGPVSKKPVTSLRSVIARRMWESWNAVPHVTQFDNSDFTRLNELRKQHAPAYEQRGAKLTLTPLVLKAVAETLKQHPIFNSSLDEAANEIVFKEYIHIGIAVDTEQGLIVPVVRDVDKKSVLDLARELEALARRARDRKVNADELKGGTFTISNQGAIGGAHFTPIVNKPEVAILGLGRGAMKPVVREGKVEVRMMTPMALSYDHRVIDGGSAARFVVDLVKALENFGEEKVKL